MGINTESFIKAYKMTDPGRAATEKQRGSRAYKKGEYEAAVLHYEEAFHLDPSDLEPPYRIARAKFEQKVFHECIYHCETAVKVGKMNKGDVKIVANAYVLGGRAKIELGDSDKGREDIEKAVTFLAKIADVKSANDKLDECSKFCERAIKIGKENIVNYEVMEKVLEIKFGLNIRHNKANPEKNQKLFLTRMVDICEDCYNLRARDQAQYEFCIGWMEQITENKLMTVNGEHGNEYHRACGLRGRALRRIHGVDEAFDDKPWRKYSERDDKFFIPYEAFRLLYHDVEMEDPGAAFCMMDVNGLGRINIKDAPQMMIELNLIDGVEDDGIRFLE